MIRPGAFCSVCILCLAAAWLTASAFNAAPAADPASSDGVPPAPAATGQASPSTGEGPATGALPAPAPPPPPGAADEAEETIDLPLLPATASDDEDPGGDPSAEREDAAGASAVTLAEKPPGLLENFVAHGRMRVLFEKGSSELDETARAELLALARYLTGGEGNRVELRAHSHAGEGTDSEARWLSLSRALAVRAFLVDKGVPIDRLHLRPLGSEYTDGPPDRVDILSVRR